MPGQGDTNQLSVANTNRDGTGTLVTLKTAGAMGSQVYRIDVIAISTTTAGMVRLFVTDGTNKRLYWEFPVTAITPSGTVQAFTTNLVPSPALPLKPGWSLLGSTNNAETFNVLVTSVDN